MNPKPHSHIPPLRYHALTPVYDWAVKWTTNEAAVKKRVASQLSQNQVSSVLDIATGTGNLALLLESTIPKLEISAVDVDLQALQIAEAKADAVNSQIEFIHGDALNLPFANDSYDTVVCSLFFHHLTTDQKRKAAAEVRRVLKDGGVFLVADWAPPKTLLSSFGFFLVQLLDGFETTKDSRNGMLPSMLLSAGFEEIDTVACWNAPLGTIELLECRFSRSSKS